MITQHAVVAFKNYGDARGSRAWCARLPRASSLAAAGCRRGSARPPRAAPPSLPPGPRARQVAQLALLARLRPDAWRTVALMRCHLALELVELQDLDQVGVFVPRRWPPPSGRGCRACRDCNRT